MSTESRPQQVVVAYDFSPSADHALQLALDVAVRDPQVVLHVLAAIPPEHGLPIAPIAHADYPYADNIHERLAELVRAGLAGRPVDREVPFFVHARLGNPADEILHLAAEIGAHLVLVGSHGRTGVERALLGSVSERVVREARCPVMVARPREYGDVDLLAVAPAPHVRHPHARPHRYSYIDNRVQKRPDDWPLL